MAQPANPPFNSRENGTKKEKRGFRHKLKRDLQKPRFAVEFGAFVVLIFYTIFTGYQSCKMRQSTEAAKESADASVATVRAWVGTEEYRFSYIDQTPSPNKIFSPMFSVTLNNVGKTPAQRLEMTAEFLFDNGEKDRIFGSCPGGNKSAAPFLIAGQKMGWSSPIKDIPKEDFAKLRGDTNDSIYAHGCIWYNDVVSNKRRFTEFCLRYYGPTVETFCHVNNRME